MRVGEAQGQLGGGGSALNIILNSHMDLARRHRRLASTARECQAAIPHPPWVTLRPRRPTRAVVGVHLMARVRGHRRGDGRECCHVRRAVRDLGFRPGIPHAGGSMAPKFCSAVCQWQ